MAISPVVGWDVRYDGRIERRHAASPQFEVAGAKSAGPRREANSVNRSIIIIDNKIYKI